MSLLDASHLEAEEQALLEGQAPEPKVLTLQDAVEAIRRIAYHNRMKAQEEAEADALLAPFLAEVERIRNWQAERRQRREESIAYHASKCEAYYRANPPAKVKGKEVKFIDLPGGRIAAKDPAAKWKWADEDAVIATVQTILPMVVKQKPVLDKNALKESARVEEGKVYVVTADGEKVELAGVTVEIPETEYKVTVEV